MVLTYSIFIWPLGILSQCACLCLVLHSDLLKNFSTFAKRLREQEAYLHECASARHQFERDVVQVKQLSHEVELACSMQLPMDSGLEMLKKHVQCFKVLFLVAIILPSS